MKNYKSLLAGIVAMAMVSGYVSPNGINRIVMADEKKTEVPKSLSFKMNNLEEESVDLAKYAGKVVVFVNVASKCGYTKQYAGLEKLYKTYKDKGLVIVGVPCNQFGAQEAGTNKEIRTFCTSTYDVTFDMLAKVDVKNSTACDLYKYLTAQETTPLGKGDVKWNFEKFVLDRKGNVVGRFGSSVAPESKEFVSLIESALAK
ncbi:MAG: glutathione peroxidase [Pirellula sp.]|nr:glutathione peroxidase [Pirellula sp.]